MTGEEEGKERGFRVEDRRRFVSLGEEETRPSEESARLSPEREVTEAAESSSTPRPETPPYTQATPPPETEITFSSFILGLTTQALIYMGEVTPAPGQQPQIDLSAAQQMIDILAMLKQKTAGNLESGEETMLGNALFDLRMRYVDLVKKSRGGTHKRDKQ